MSEIFFRQSRETNLIISIVRIVDANVETAFELRCGCVDVAVRYYVSAGFSIEKKAKH